MTYFKASLDTTSKIISVAFALLIVGMIVGNLFLGEEENAHLTVIITSAFLIGVFVFCYAYAPRGYGIESGTLIIMRPAKDRRISFSEIESSCEIPREDLKNSIRTFGVGGLFGYWGKYYSPQIGHANWYVTHRKNLLLITLKEGEKILLSPDNSGLRALLPR